MRQIILIVGFVLIGLAFVSVTFLGAVMMRAGGAPVSYAAAGKPAMFLPGGHLPIVLVGVAVGLVVAFRSIRRRVRKQDDEGPTDL